MAFLKSADALLIIIGPSGSGKSSVIHELARREIIEVTPSWTTRPPRQGESENSVEHVFVSEQEFDKQRANGFFLEVVSLFDLPYRYGLPQVQAPKDKLPLIMLRAPLLPMVPKHYNNPTIYQIEDDQPRVEERLGRREAEGEQQGTRLQDYQKEVSVGRHSASRIFTNQADIISLATSIEVAIKQDFEPRKLS